MNNQSDLVKKDGPEKETKKKQGSTKRIKIGVLIAVAVAAVYAVLFFRWVYSQSVDTEILRIGTIEESYNMDAYLVRNEEVLVSPFDGKYVADVPEGDRVRVKERVATVLNDDAQKLMNDMKAMDLRIIKAQKERYDKREFFSSDVAKIDNDINAKVKQLVLIADSNETGQLLDIEDDIDGLIQKKALIIGTSGTADNFLKSLKAEKDTLQAKIDHNTKDIISNTSGIISYSVDGYEETLKKNSILSITPSFLEGIKNEGKPKRAVENTVFSGKPFSKVIKDMEYYIVTDVDADKSKLYKVDDTLGIRFNDIGKTIKGSVDYLSENQNGKCILAVKTDEGLSETAGLRKTNIDIIKSSYSGLKVPLKSLKEIDKKTMTAKITLDSANYASIRKVKLAGMNDEWAVIESIKESPGDSVSLYDVYVVNPDNIVRGQPIAK